MLGRSEEQQLHKGVVGKMIGLPALFMHCTKQGCFKWDRDLVFCMSVLERNLVFCKSVMVWG